jgi:hypothetical protein
MKKIISLSLFLVFMIGLGSCTSYTFIKTGTAQHLAPQDEDCPIVVYNSMGPEIKYQDIGICIARSPDYMMMDNTEKAIEQVKACACEKGGNALFIESIEREMDLDGLYWTRVTATLMIVEQP